MHSVVIKDGKWVGSTKGSASNLFRFKVICEPVPAELTPYKLESGTGVRTPIHSGIPALAGYNGITDMESAGKIYIVV